MKKMKLAYEGDGEWLLYNDESAWTDAQSYHLGREEEERVYLFLRYAE